MLPADQGQPLADDEKKCQFCGNVIKKRANVCRFCKKRQQYFCQCDCPECGEPFEIASDEQGAKFLCPECGLVVVPIMREDVVKCPQCQGGFIVNVEKLGEKLRCPHCNNLIQTNRKKSNLHITGHVSGSKNPIAAPQSNVIPVLQSATGSSGASVPLVSIIAAIFMIVMILVCWVSRILLRIALT